MERRTLKEREERERKRESERTVIRDHRAQRAPFHAPPQAGKEIDGLHRVAHVDEGVKAA